MDMYKTVYGYHKTIFNACHHARSKYKRRTMRYLFIFIVFYLVDMGNAAAYVGPGLGLGAIGAFIGVVVTVLLAIIGLFWYPLKRLIRKAHSKPDYC